MDRKRNGVDILKAKFVKNVLTKVRRKKWCKIKKEDCCVVSRKDWRQVLGGQEVLSDDCKSQR